MTRITRLLALGAAAVCMAAAPAAQAKLKRITIGTNPQGTVYFLLGSGFAKTFQEKLNIRSTAQPHSGSTVYVPLVNNGEVTLGLNNTMDSGNAYAGRDDYKKPLKNLRALVMFWTIPYGLMVRGDSPIKSLDDLRGKKVVVHIKPNRSLTPLTLRIMETAGIMEKDVVSMDSGGLVKNIDLVVQGRADAAAVAYSMPATRKAHASTPGGVRFLPLGPKGTDAFMDAGVSGTATMMATPHKTRPFFKEPTKIAAFQSFLNAGKAVNADDAYALVKTLHQNWKAMQKAYGPLRGVKENKIAPATNPLPYHEGAIRYFKEIGIWTAANEKRQKEVMSK
jgi:TRAP transporter TAXI family solute receptor